MVYLNKLTVNQHDYFGMELYLAFLSPYKSIHLAMFLFWKITVFPFFKFWSLASSQNRSSLPPKKSWFRARLVYNSFWNRVITWLRVKSNKEFFFASRTEKENKCFLLTKWILFLLFDAFILSLLFSAKYFLSVLLSLLCWSFCSTVKHLLSCRKF